MECKVFLEMIYYVIIFFVLLDLDLCSVIYLGQIRSFVFTFKDTKAWGRLTSTAAAHVGTDFVFPHVQLLRH